MEPTYYWDALQPEVLEWLNTHTAPGQTYVRPLSDFLAVSEANEQVTREYPQYRYGRMDMVCPRTAPGGICVRPVHSPG